MTPSIILTLGTVNAIARPSGRAKRASCASGRGRTFHNHRQGLFARAHITGKEGAVHLTAGQRPRLIAACYRSLGPTTSSQIAVND